MRFRFLRSWFLGRFLSRSSLDHVGYLCGDGLVYDRMVVLLEVERHEDHFSSRSRFRSACGSSLSTEEASGDVDGVIEFAW